MRRKLFAVLIIAITALACAFGLAACGGDDPDDGGSKHNGTYYLYVDGDYDLTTYYELSGKTFDYHYKYYRNGELYKEDMIGYSGYYTVKKVSSGMGDFNGFINNGVIERVSKDVVANYDYDTVEYYCMIGKVPDDIHGGSGKLEYHYRDNYADEIHNGIAVFGMTVNSETVVIPSTYNGKDVRYISDSAFRNCKNLKKVVIPNTVEHIETNAFYGCTNLTDVTFSDNLIWIGDSAFRGCTSLRSISLPSSVTEIYKRAFEGCENLNNVSLGNIESIGNGAFFNCPNLLQVTLPSTEIEIDTYRVDSSVSWKGYAAAFGKSSSPRVTVLGGETISDGFFSGAKISAVDLPDTLKTIGKNAFSDTALITITLPEKLTTIGENAFKDSRLKEVTNYSNATYNFGSDVHIINNPLQSYVFTYGDYVFYDDDHNYTLIGLDIDYVSDVYELPSEVKQYGIVLSFTYDIRQGALDYGFVKSIKLPSNITSIDNGAFKDYSNLKSIEIPDNVITIGYGVFANCSNLTIYCEAAEKPDGWSDSWNPENFPVVWDCKNQ